MDREKNLSQITAANQIIRGLATEKRMDNAVSVQDMSVPDFDEARLAANGFSPQEISELRALRDTVMLKLVRDGHIIR